MIIDAYTSIWSSLDQLGPEMATRMRRMQSERWGQLDCSSTEHDRAMACVDAALVFGFRSEMLGACVPNEFVANFVAKNPTRRIGVAGIDPLADDAMDQLELAARMGLAAVSICPVAQGVHPSHSSAMRVYDRCVELSMPMFVSGCEPLTRSAHMEFGRPVLWDEVAQSFPGLPIVINQLGHPWIDECLTLLGKHENMYADLSGVASRTWQLYNALLNAASYGVIEKLLFASSFPRDIPTKVIENLYSINTLSHGSQFPSVARSKIRGIVERNTLELLGIEADVSQRAAAGRSSSDDALETQQAVAATQSDAS